MYPEEISLTINGVTYRAMWFDKEEDRVAEWYISNDKGEQFGRFRGYPGNYKQVENFIRHFIAK